MRTTMSSRSLAQLREEAEARLAGLLPRGTPARSAEELLYELRVHQLALEMQNESLRLAQIALEASRERYADLYEFAPIACLTLTSAGQIAEINLTGAALLGEDRGKLLNRRFVRHVVSEERDQWHLHLMRMQQRAMRTCELEMQRSDGTRFHAALYCSLFSSDDAPALRIALTDITAQKHAETTRREFEARLHQLTPRERQVLQLALCGMPNKDIAARLQVSQRTVENHRSRIHLKTGVMSLLELAHQAACAGVALAALAPSVANRLS